MNEIIQIILTIVAVISSSIAALIGFFVRSKFNSIDKGVEEAKQNAKEASRRSSEIENNYNKKFIEVNKNLEELRITTISELHHMERQITSKLYDIQIAIVTGKLGPIIKDTEEHHSSQ